MPYFENRRFQAVFFLNLRALQRKLVLSVQFWYPLTRKFIHVREDKVWFSKIEYFRQNILHYDPCSDRNDSGDMK